MTTEFAQAQREKIAFSIPWKGWCDTHDRETESVDGCPDCNATEFALGEQA